MRQLVSEELHEFIDDIDNQVVKTELMRLISIAATVDAGTAPEAQTRLAQALERITATYDEAIRKQRASINRLLGYNADAGIRVRNLEREVARLQDQINSKAKVGPE
jgi:hypothetical protein